MLYPVIDLLGGRCMRALREGANGPLLDEDDPIAIALRWRDQGAQWLHIVDLDGARAGAPQQLETIQAIIQAVGLPAQIAGGLHDSASVEAALAAGAERVVLSAASPDEQALVAECVVRWGPRIAAALNARDGRVTVAGWLPSDAASALDVARAMGYLGVETLLYTSVVTSSGSDPLPGQLRRALPAMRLIAGGAIDSLDAVRNLVTLGMDGVLLGRALYDAMFTLEDALVAASEAAALAPGRTQHSFSANEEDEEEAVHALPVSDDASGTSDADNTCAAGVPPPPAPPVAAKEMEEPPSPPRAPQRASEAPADHPAANGEDGT